MVGAVVTRCSGETERGARILKFHGGALDHGLAGVSNTPCDVSGGGRLGPDGGNAYEDECCKDGWPGMSSEAHCLFSCFNTSADGGPKQKAHLPRNESAVGASHA